MSKVYYYHTSKLEVSKLGIVPTCTIALKKEGNKFVYGIAICSKYDNFSRKQGREIAENRLNQRFGELEVPKNLDGLSDHQAALRQLFSIVRSVIIKNRKWKRKVTSFNLQNRIGKPEPVQG